jgi:hypothetical protein
MINSEHRQFNKELKTILRDNLSINIDVKSEVYDGVFITIRVGLCIDGEEFTSDTEMIKLP